MAELKERRYLRARDFTAQDVGTFRRLTRGHNRSHRMGKE